MIKSKWITITPKQASRLKPVKKITKEFLEKLLECRPIKGRAKPIPKEILDECKALSEEDENKDNDEDDS